jgi:hypothetical protein
MRLFIRRWFLVLRTVDQNIAVLVRWTKSGWNWATENPATNRVPLKKNALVHQGTRAKRLPRYHPFSPTTPGHSASDTMDAASWKTGDEPGQVYLSPICFLSHGSLSAGSSGGIFSGLPTPGSHQPGFAERSTSAYSSPSLLLMVLLSHRAGDMSSNP